MTIKQLKQKYSLSDSDIAKAFEYASTASYSNSSAKRRIETGIVNMYAIFERVGKKEKTSSDAV